MGRRNAVGQGRDQGRIGYGMVGKGRLMQDGWTAFMDRGVEDAI